MCTVPCLSTEKRRQLGITLTTSLHRRACSRLSAAAVAVTTTFDIETVTPFCWSFWQSLAPQSSRPKQALSLSVRAPAHFRWLRGHHGSQLVQIYAAGFELLCVASLRMRDAQRALLSYHEAIAIYGDKCDKVQDRVGFVRGKCFTPKHPKRRANKEKLFYGPKRVPAKAARGRMATYGSISFNPLRGSS